MHNVPKLWGDETVRFQEKIIDFKSNSKAAGKVSGLGWYDGATDSETQPWKWAQKDSTVGLLKRIDKGRSSESPAYMMKGVLKEVQKVLGSDVHNCTVASRVAEGHEEWLLSLKEKQHVIDE
ncbi:glycosyltransferase family 1 protein [Apiospora sp. TS-2023a]